MFSYINAVKHTGTCNMLAIWVLYHSNWLPKYSNLFAIHPVLRSFTKLNYIYISSHLEQNAERVGYNFVISVFPFLLLRCRALLLNSFSSFYILCLPSLYIISQILINFINVSSSTFIYFSRFLFPRSLLQWIWLFLLAFPFSLFLIKCIQFCFSSFFFFCAADDSCLS